MLCMPSSVKAALFTDSEARCPTVRHRTRCVMTDTQALLRATTYSKLAIDLVRDVLFFCFRCFGLKRGDGLVV